MFVVERMTGESENLGLKWRGKIECFLGRFEGKKFQKKRRK